MKVLHVVPTYFPAVRYGGPIVSVHGLCRALAARGHQVDVLTTNVDGPGTLDVPVETRQAIDGVGVTYFRSEFPRLYRSAGMGRRLRSDAALYDVVHSHAVFLWPGVAASRAARDAGVPYVISPRGMLVPELIEAKSTVLKRLWLRFMEERAFRHAAGIHFTSTLEQEEASRVGVVIPRAFVVPNGIDLAPRPGVPRDESRLVFLGRISWKKGLDRVVEALPSLPGVRFEIAGNDDEGLTPRLQDLAHRLGVEHRVAFRGPLYGPDKDAFLARGTVCVLMSQSENFGNSVLEALAMETPVVLSPDVGLSETVVAAGAGVIGLERLPELLADRPRREEMGRRGRALVESRFTWDRVAAEMEEVYRCSTRSPL